MNIKNIFSKPHEGDDYEPYRDFADICSDMKLHGPFLMKVNTNNMARIFKSLDTVTEHRNGGLSIRLGRDLYCPETILEEFTWQDGTPAGKYKVK